MAKRKKLAPSTLIYKIASMLHNLVDHPDCTAKMYEPNAREIVVLVERAGYRRDAWVSVEDRLPEDRQDVLFVTAPFHYADGHRDPGGQVLGGRFNRTHFDLGAGGFSTPGVEHAATHWMPAPLPPTSGNDGEAHDA